MAGLESNAPRGASLRGAFASPGAWLRPARRGLRAHLPTLTALRGVGVPRVVAGRVGTRGAVRGAGRADDHALAVGERGCPGLQVRAVEPAHPDRKSTRLNSSHRCISYAV